MKPQEELNRRFSYEEFTKNPIDQDVLKNVCAAYLQLAELVNAVLPDNRASSLALTKLEESVNWAVKSSLNGEVNLETRESRKKLNAEKLRLDRRKIAKENNSITPADLASRRKKSA